MFLESGRRLGPYEVVEPAGAGGMGEVYKATDTRLERTVAIKVLPEHLSAEPELRKRFEQEARTISNLNHPRICTLYDVGSEDGVDFLVMEYLEGETLAARLGHGALRLDEALTYARQIADALDKAHRSGVVHRDLKPGNIMLTKDGVKLLDFGLAKLRAKALDPALSALPTQDQPLTREGSIVGTLHYMPPEQLEGKDVDARADMFSLGAVLYEMITGKKAFEGETPASVITAVMSATPKSMAELKPITPSSVERLVTSCLAKDRDARWQSAADFARELTWVGDDEKAATPNSSAKLGWVVAALAAIAALGLGVFVRPHPDRAAELVRFTVSPPEGSFLRGFRRESRPAVSPDGSRIAFLVQREGTLWLTVRHLAESDARILTAADVSNPLDPVWSPDGESILYRIGGKLMRIDADGGGPREVADTRSLSVAWSENGVLLYGDIAAPIRRLDGGEPVTALEEGELSHAHPQFLPGGERFLFFSPSKRAIYVSSLDSLASSFVRSADSYAIYAEPGFILFVESDTLMAQPFDPTRGTVEGRPVPLARDVDATSLGYAAFSVSHDVLVYRGGNVERRLEWFDRAGASLGPVGEPGRYAQVVLSPDGRRAIVLVPGSALWILDLERGGIATRLTREGTRGGDPVWSPDGTEIVVSLFGSGRTDLYRLRLAAGAEPERLLSADENLWGDQWLAADNHVTFHDSSTISLLPMDGGEPRALISQSSRVDEPYRSPDGRWLAFVSDDTGRYEVYVQNLDTSERSRVSTDGGGQPRWRADGLELFYLSNIGEAMAVDFDPDSGVRGVAQTLFQTRIETMVPTLDQWDVHPDGERFLLLVPTGAERPIHVILNWQNLLEED